MTPTTPCDCAHPGWCDRHQCFKTAFSHWLCQHDEQRFAEWERGGGLRSPPERFAPVTPGSPSAAAAVQSPGLLQRAANLGQALVRHAADGLQTVGDATYEHRLATCRQCELCDLARMVCRHTDCGCWLTVKARWASETCPVQKWNVLAD